MTIRNGNHDPKHFPMYKDMAALWIFAESMIDLELCNYLSDMTLSKLENKQEPCPESTILYIWSHTAEDSLLRKMHIDMYAAAWKLWIKEVLPGCRIAQDSYAQRFVKDFEVEQRGLLFEFLLQVVSNYVADDVNGDSACMLNEGGIIKAGIRCNYNRHEDGKKCGK